MRMHGKFLCVAYKYYNFLYVHQLLGFIACLATSNTVSFDIGFNFKIR